MSTVATLQFSYCDKHSKTKYYYKEDGAWLCMICDWDARPPVEAAMPRELAAFTARYGSNYGRFYKQ